MFQTRERESSYICDQQPTLGSHTLTYILVYIFIYFIFIYFSLSQNLYKCLNISSKISNKLSKLSPGKIKINFNKYK